MTIKTTRVFDINIIIEKINDRKAKITFVNEKIQFVNSGCKLLSDNLFEYYEMMRNDIYIINKGNFDINHIYNISNLKNIYNEVK